MPGRLRSPRAGLFANSDAYLRPVLALARQENPGRSPRPVATATPSWPPSWSFGAKTASAIILPAGREGPGPLEGPLPALLKAPLQWDALHTAHAPGRKEEALGGSVSPWHCVDGGRGQGRGTLHHASALCEPLACAWYQPALRSFRTVFFHVPTSWRRSRCPFDG